MAKCLLLILLLIAISSNISFYIKSTRIIIKRLDCEANPSVKKGFGKAIEPKPIEDKPTDVGTKTYELQAKRGVPEYNIFIRPVNGTEIEWLPVGSMVRLAFSHQCNSALIGPFRQYHVIRKLPSQFSKSNLSYLKVVEKVLFVSYIVAYMVLFSLGAFKLYPNLRAFSELQSTLSTNKGSQGSPQGRMFEYGSCLKAFPDEPISLLAPPGESSQDGSEDGGGGIGWLRGWLRRVTDPLDASDLRGGSGLSLK